MTTLLEQAMELENSGLATRVAELAKKADGLPFNASAFAKWKEAVPELNEKWQTLADKHDTTKNAIFDLLDAYYEGQE